MASVPGDLASTVNTVVAAMREVDLVRYDQADLLRQSLRHRGRRGSEREPGLLTEALAVFCEHARRTTGVAFDDAHRRIGVAMCLGGVVEARAGADPLAATLPIYWHVITGQGVHVALIADDEVAPVAAFLRTVGRSLGIRVGELSTALDEPARRAAYESDVVLGPWQQFMTDYLRDGLRDDAAEVVARGAGAVVLPELEAILVDRANVPMTITVPNPDAGSPHARKILGRLRRGEHYVVHAGRVAFTPRGLEVLAHELARPLWTEPGDGLLLQTVHSALNAREGRSPASDRATYAQVSVADYFRRYPTIVGAISGGSARAELRNIYGIGAACGIDINPSSFMAYPEFVYTTTSRLARAMVRRVSAALSRHRRVLLVASSTAWLDQTAAVLDAAGLPFERLGEGQVLGPATGVGRVLVADPSTTPILRLAGRPVDGEWVVIGVGVGGTSYVDGHWRRLAAAGAAETACSLVSLDDPVIAGGRPRFARVTGRLPLTMVWAGTVERLRRSAWARESAKRLDGLRYESIRNRQRQLILILRRAVVAAGDLRSDLLDMTGPLVDSWYDTTPITVAELRSRMKELGVDVDPASSAGAQTLPGWAVGELKSAYRRREAEIGGPAMLARGRSATLRSIDMNWFEHLNALDFIRANAHAIYAPGSDVLVNFRRDAWIRFARLLERIRQQALQLILSPLEV